MMASLDALNEARLAKAAADKAAADAAATAAKVKISERTGGVAPLTPAQIQAAVAKLGAGKPLTPAEQAAVGTAPVPAGPSGPSGPSGPTGTGPTGTGPTGTGPTGTGPTGTGPTGTGPTGNTGKTYTASDGKVFDTEAAMVAYETDLRNTKLNKDAQAAADLRDRQSAYDLLYNEFNKYGLGSLVEGIKGLIQSNVSPSQFSIELQNTKEYQARFSANQERIAQGLKALTPAEYIGMEDQYQNIMRNYGLPASYWSKDTTGKQAGFDKFLANDVSATELENRIATAQQRVVNSNPEVLRALKQFYPDISNGDILSYALDPKNALDNINRKVTAAEIGGAALAQGLQALGGTAESLAGAGITKAQAQQGYTNVAEMLPRGSQLADIYNQGPYTQGTAEAEVFNTAGAAEAAKKRKKLTALETASFSGSSGVGSLNRDRAVSNYMLGQPGAGSY